MNDAPPEKLPKIFVGCSTKAHRVAQALQSNLRFVAFPKIWSQNTFEPSHSTIEDLIRDAPKYDFAVFILAPDDINLSQETQQHVTRDNVIFETGLFMGILGRERVFLIKRRDMEVKLPSDLLGVNPIDYIAPPPDDDDAWESALGHAASTIEAAVKRLGFRALAQEVVKTSEEQSQSAAQFFDKLLVEKYGASTKLDSLMVTILDLEGAATYTRCLQGIKVSGGIKVDQFAGMVASTTPGGKITRPPSFVKPVKFPKPVTMKYKVQTDELCEFGVAITGSLTNFDPELDFEYESSIERFCLMTQEEINQAYKESDFPYEYISLRSEMPTDKTIVEIQFPEGYKVECFPGVFFGESESIHDLELYRVRNGFETLPRGARFSITQPLIGFNYLIFWLSPPLAKFDRMKQTGI
jgi:Predicted nucleotide-binding protein containing TIR -like domain